MNLLQRALGPVFVLLWSSGYLAGTARDAGGAPVRPDRLAVPARRACCSPGIAVVTRAPWPRGRRAWRDLVITGVLLQGVQFGAAYGALGARRARGPGRARALPVARAGRGARPGRCWASGWAARAGGARGSRCWARSWRARTTSSAAGGSAAGLGLLLLGLAGFAAGTLYQKRTGATMDLRTGTAVQLLAGAVAVLPVALADRARPARCRRRRPGAAALRVDRRDELGRGRGPAVRAAAPRHRRGRERAALPRAAGHRRARRAGARAAARAADRRRARADARRASCW